MTREETTRCKRKNVKHNSDFKLVNKSLDFKLKVWCLMESFRECINELIQKTLTMEDPAVIALHNKRIYSHSQPMYETNDNAVDYSEEILESSQQQPEKSQESSQQNPADKIVTRHKIRYTTTRIKYSSTRVKSGNFLSNISYTGISKSDFYNENFILDVYVLLVKNMNRFSLSRKITD